MLLVNIPRQKRNSGFDSQVIRCINFHYSRTEKAIINVDNDDETQECFHVPEKPVPLFRHQASDETTYENKSTMRRSSVERQKKTWMSIQIMPEPLRLSISGSFFLIGFFFVFIS